MDKNNLDELFAKIDPVKKFKQRIHFDQLTSLEDPTTRVVANWQQLSLTPVAQGMNVAEPVVSVSTVGNEKGQVRIQWVLPSGKNMTTLVAVDAITSDGARKQFMANAEFNSMPDLPFVKGPANLGTVSAISKDDRAGYVQLFWVYRNMYFKINVRGTFDRISLARFIQEHAEKNLRPISE